MRIFCKKAQEQIRLKLITELLVLWQLGILVSVTETKLIFYSCEPGFCLWDSGPQGLCSLVSRPVLPKAIPLVLF